jgi:hypothetical protein
VVDIKTVVDLREAQTNSSAVHLWRSLGFEVLTTVPEAFDHPTQGLVGLHLMFRRV